MLIDTLQTLFGRDLRKLKAEIELYQTESNLWLIEKGIANSAGNLCLHLVGNLNTYVGATIGKSNYVRNRELEFSAKQVARSELIKMVEETIEIVKSSLDELDDTTLNKEYPVLVFAEKTSMGFMLVHLTTHLAYHLGQVNYHRRLLDIN